MSEPLTVEYLDEVYAHLLHMAPHVRPRKTAQMLSKCYDEIIRLRAREAELVGAIERYMNQTESSLTTEDDVA